MDTLTLYINILTLVGSGILQIRFVDTLAGKRVRIVGACIYLAAMAALEYLGECVDLGASIIFVQVAVLWAVSHWVNHHANPVAGIGAVLAIYVTQLAFGLLNSISVFLLPPLLLTPMFPWFRLLVAALSLVVAALTYTALLRCLKFKDQESLPYAALVAFPAAFFLGVQVYIQHTSYTVAVSSLTDAEKAAHMALFALQLLGLGALICTLLAYRRVLANFDAQKSLASFRQAAQMQRVYVDEARARYEKTRAFRHDVQNHLLVLDGLLQRNQPDAAREYLKSLELNASELSLPVRTGNGVVDILLAEKLAQADGIRTNVDVHLPKDSGIDDFDWCVLFSNAVDNAVHACRKVERDPWITIHGKRQGDYYLLEFENSSPEGPLPSYGTGLENIRTAVERHGGSMLTEKNGAQFSLGILLDISGPHGHISAQDA